MHDELAIRAHGFDARGRGRRRAVAVRLPEGSQVAEEAPALIHDERLPECGGVVPDRRHHLAPIHAARGEVAHLAPHLAQETKRGTGPGVERRGAVVPVWGAVRFAMW